MSALAVDALAVARLTRLVTRDEIAAPLRDRVASNPRTPDAVVYLVSCPRCVSVYAGAAAVIARRMAPRLWDPLARALAASELVCLATDAFEAYAEAHGPDPFPEAGTEE